MVPLPVSAAFPSNVLSEASWVRREGAQILTWMGLRDDAALPNPEVEETVASTRPWVFVDVFVVGESAQHPLALT